MSDSNELVNNVKGVNKPAQAKNGTKSTDEKTGGYTARMILKLTNAGAYEFIKALRERVTNAGLRTENSHDKALSKGGNGQLGFDVCMNSITFQLVIATRLKIRVLVITYSESAKEKLGLELKPKNFGVYHTIENMAAVHDNQDSAIHFLLGMNKTLQL